VERRIRFGPFELDRQTGELWKNGSKVRLQGKPFQVLVALLERPGEPVSREELQQRLWSGDTFVDFESGLNTAANRLRLTLGDSADSPRYVETLARSGYRFMAKVEEIAQPAPAKPPEKPRTNWWIPAATAGAIVLAGIIWLAARKPTAEPPKFQQITFRRGPVTGARFTPDGQNVLYSAKVGNQPWKVYLASPVSPEARSLGFDGSSLNAVSRSGELLLLSSERTFGNLLSRVPMNGGSPLALASRVACADWSPDGKNIAAVRLEGNAARIEFPLGKSLYRTASVVSCLSVSPDGRMIAFAEHPVQGDDGGDLKLLDLNGNVRTLAAGWATLAGLAWPPSGKEVWFTAARTGGTRSLWAVSLSGKVRLVSRVPGSLRLEDISRDGRVLVAQQDWHLEMAGRLGQDSAEHDLTWFDWTGAEDLSADGNLVLFDESGDGGGPNWTVYLHRSSDGSTLRLGEGHALALAPDGRFAAILNPTNRNKITIVPVGAGQPREISGGIEYQWARYFPDGQQLLVSGNEPGGSMRFFLQSVNGGRARPLSPDIFLGSPVISPDGKWIAGTDQDVKLVVVAWDGSQRRIIPTENAVETVGWSADSRSVLVCARRSVPARISSIDLVTGRAKFWREIGPTNLNGVQAIYKLLITPDMRSYVYSFDRVLVQLYLADGLK